MRTRLFLLMVAVMAPVLSPTVVVADTVVPAAVRTDDAILASKADKTAGSDKADKTGGADKPAQAPAPAPKVETPPTVHPPAGVRSVFATYRVFATQFEPSTPNSVQVAVPDKCIKFAALGDSATLGVLKCPASYALGRDYRVAVTRDGGQDAVIPVKETGPWNIDDSWWGSGAESRRMFSDLPAGTPESSAAYSKGYNTVSDCKDLEGNQTGKSGGADQFGRCVRNPAGIDLSPAAARQLGLAAGENAWVTVSLLWQPLDMAVTNVHSTQNLDITGATSATTPSGAAAIQKPPTSANSQLWRFGLAGDDAFTISSVSAAKTLDIAGGATAPLTPIVVSTATSPPAPTQRWRLVVISGTGSETVFGIASAATDQRLDVRDGSMEPGAPVIQWPTNTSESQRWYLKAAVATPVTTTTAAKAAAAP